MNEKEAIAEILKKALEELKINLKEEEISKFVEVPPSIDMGDYAFPCFFLAQKFQEEPHEIAIEIREKIREIPEEFEDIETSGPYINFFVNKKNLVSQVIYEILAKKERFGKPKLTEKNRAMVEFSQPNTHKAFHVGHIRGTSLGESISRILEFLGNKVTRANYSGDTGMHVAKWLWCYTKYHSKEKLRNDESWIAGIYVEAMKKLEGNKKFQEEADTINWALEGKKNNKLNQIWKKSRRFSIDSWKKIYKELNVEFDVQFFESEMEKRAKAIAYELREKKIASKSDGAVIVNLKKYNLGVWVLLRKDGTVLYSAKDLALAEKKISKYKISKNIIVHGSEQNLHFKQLFKTLDLMKFQIKSEDVGFDLVRLPRGKMSSRTGENILYSDFMKEMTNYAKKEIKKRLKTKPSAFPSQVQEREEKISKSDLENRALKISIAAIKYSMLKQNPNKNIIFSKEESLNFEGDSGPYLLYSYARAKSILKKSKDKKQQNQKEDSSMELENEETKLIKILSQFPEVVLNSGKNLNPSLIANYSYKLAQSFNEFYHSCPVINSKNEDFRIKLVKSFVQVMKNSLDLLGIKILEKM